MPTLRGLTIRTLLCTSLVLFVDASYAAYNIRMPQYAESFYDETKDYGVPEASDVSENTQFFTGNADENNLYEENTKSNKKSSETEEFEFDIFSSDDKITTESNYYRNQKFNMKVKNYDADYRYNYKISGRSSVNNRHRKPNYRSNEVNHEDGEYLDSNNEYTHAAKLYRRKPRDRQMTPKTDFTNNGHSSPKIYTISDEINESYIKRRKEINDKQPKNFKYQALVKKKYPKDYINYAEYDDMRRVIKIKDELPTLLKIPKARDTGPNDLDTEGVKETNTTEATITELYKQNETTVTGDKDFNEFTTLTPNKLRESVTKEISIADKSKLSILRKSQKKDRVKENITKKPPVLLRIQTSSRSTNINTVVMLEPYEATSVVPDNIFRAREVSDDSEETLKKVKKIMREKLVKNAKNINDLIDDWDKMVCHYIDTSLLKNNVANSKAKISLIIVSSLYMFLNY